MNFKPDLKNRSAYWDNIKGVLILLVVIGHCLYAHQTVPSANGIVDAVYLFHMPAFVFVSGYFGKSERSRSFYSVVRLVFAYLVFNSLVGFYYGFHSITEPMYSYWYLLALVIWRVTADKLAKFKDITLILVGIAMIAGFYAEIDNAYAMARVISFYPFYMAGYKLSEDSVGKIKGRKTAVRLSIAAAAAAGAAVIGYCVLRFCMPNMLTLTMSAYSAPLDVYSRICVFAVSALAIIALLHFSPDRNIPFLTMIGRNSIAIFLIHRPITFIFSDLFIDCQNGLIILYAFAATILLCAVLGNDVVAWILNVFLNAGAGIFAGKDEKTPRAAELAAKMLVLVVALAFLADVMLGIYFKDEIDASPENIQSSPSVSEDGNMYRAASDAQLAAFDSAFRITFAGDLILLEDQVKRAYTDNGYDFSDVFEYSEPYISSADLAIGVFEGPMAGEEAGYSTSNFADGKALALNFPDEFGTAVKNAGFDLVTTANNHVLDKNPAGVERTLEVLDRIGLDHTGSYRNEEEKQASRVKIIDKDNIRFAVLSYTYGIEVGSDISRRLEYVSSYIPEYDSEYFEEYKAKVGEDFEEAKKYSPDLIIVLPHIGTQFLLTSDANQEAWFKVFKDFGADIILGDHPHAPEPAYIENYNGRNVFSAYCPGNFANIYREDYGDASALVEVYIDRNTKTVIGGGIVPLYTQSPADGNYRALPTYEVMHNKELRKSLSTDDIERAEKAHNVIMKAMLGETPKMSCITKSCLFDENGYIRAKTTGLELTEKMKNGVLWQKLSNAGTVCFMGDSLTEGTKNGGCPWYEPIEEYLTADVINVSRGGATVSYLTDSVTVMPAADLYVIAIGTNDVRYRDDTCALTADAYTARLAQLKDIIRQKNPSAEFVFIAPWYSIDGDKFCPLTFREKTALNEEYTAALERFCTENGDAFINANGYIKDRIDHTPTGKYLLDHIHPNASEGVVMYSEAVLSR